MSAGGWMMLAVLAATVIILAFLLVSLARSIRVERAAHRSMWREFGLGILLVILFFVSWIGQAVTQWQTFTDEQLAHGSSPTIGDFLAEFGQSTFENWQSEFLQLFSFVVLAALYIHKGSAESKDGEEEIQASLRRLEEHFGTLPPNAPSEPGKSWKLPETPLEVHDRRPQEPADRHRHS
jgi:predicted permease